MKEKTKSTRSGKIISWIFSIVFFVIGILNVILVHIVPGVIYILLSLTYLPWTNALLKRKFGFSIPIIVKIVFGLVILWGTLAVGDLVEILGL